MNLQTRPNEPSFAPPTAKIDISALMETSLPPSPESIMRISKLLRDYNTPARKITEAVRFEPMLVARLLRLANSAIYGLERTVTSIEMAISTVGNKTLHEIVMMELASSAFSRAISGSFVARKIWEHSLAVAIIARELSEILKLQGTEESFTCGLLHDIGKLLLLSYDFNGFTTLLGEQDEDRMLTAEQDLYGYSHAEIGSIVARHWRLQEEVCYTIHFHHKPFLSSHPMMVAHIVEIADIMANVKGFGLRQEEESKLLESQSITRLRLEDRDLRIIWTRSERAISETIRAFA